MFKEELEEKKERVFALIKQKQKESANKSGLMFVTIYRSFDFEFNTMRDIVNSLYFDNKIIIREGVNGKLIFLSEGYNTFG